MMLSSKRHVTLRLTVFEIFAVKWLKFEPKISDLGDPWGHRPQKRKDLFGTDMYRHAKCHANRCHRRRDICNRTEKKNSKLSILPYYTYARRGYR